MLFLDSASIDDARKAGALGFVGGITTNPTLMAKESVEGVVQIPKLLEVFGGLVFHQPVTLDPNEVVEELGRLHAPSSGRLVAKLPATPTLFPLVRQLRESGIPCAITGVYSPAQALVSAASGADWVIPYVNRAKRLMTGGNGLVESLARTIAGVECRLRVLAASIKSSEEAVSAIVNGADAVSTSLEVIEAMMHHDLTESAIKEFTAAARD